jgi:hypothetical protein
MPKDINNEDLRRKIILHIHKTGFPNVPFYFYFIQKWVFVAFTFREH